MRMGTDFSIKKILAYNVLYKNHEQRSDSFFYISAVHKLASLLIALSMKWPILEFSPVELTVMSSLPASVQYHAVCQLDQV